MNLKELKEIIDFVTSKESIDELEIEKSGLRLRIKKSPSNVSSISTAASPALAHSVSSPPAAEKILPVGEDLYYIKSPFVGTFYKGSSPQEDPYVSAGDLVEKGTVVCIIEAMKLMNEVESEVAGEIVSILVENGQPVEFGERLFAILPR
ncbi:MAG: acetyl-CoA carboxylase biotin carboxyl carrier protein [Acidobacteria bacterium]|nr:acetyl-CoA carboxylase biotin carboxyl carrier protein [Acidobacteriota bacterium]